MRITFYNQIFDKMCFVDYQYMQQVPQKTDSQDQLQQKQQIAPQKISLQQNQEHQPISDETSISNTEKALRDLNVI